METVESHLLAAEQELRAGHARAALHEAHAALRLQDENGRAHALVGLANTLMGEDDDARFAFGRAVEIAPLDSRVRYLYYLGLVRLGDTNGARGQLTYFCQIEPENTQAKALLTRLGGAVMNLPPLPRPASTAVWYDGGGHALADAADVASEDPNAEPPAGPNVVVCPACEKRTWKGWVCGQCGAVLPRP